MVGRNRRVVAEGAPRDVLTPGVLEATYGAPMDVLSHGGMPVVVEPDTYAFALVVFAIATVASALIVRRRLDHLDLVEVLTARE